MVMGGGIAHWLGPGRRATLPLSDYVRVIARRLESKCPVCQIDAKRGSWLYNADRPGTQNGNSC